MLQQLLHILVISLICCSWGLLPLLLLKRMVFTDAVWYRCRAGLMAFLFLLGCMTLGLISSWLYLIIPLQFTTLLALTAVQALVTLLAGKQRLRQILSSLPSAYLPFKGLKGLPLLFFLICLLLFIILGTVPTANTDTGIYHLQIIEWASKYPAIPGIANLFPRLGLGSNWLLLISFFHIPGFSHENFSYLDTSLVIWLFVWLFHQWHYHWTHRFSNIANRGLCLFYFLVLTYSLLDWELFRNTASSTSYDPIVTTCLLLVLCCWIECIVPSQGREGGELAGPGKEPEPSRLFVFIALSALGFKLSGFFILILLAYHLMRYRHKLSYWIFTSLSFLLIVAPVLVKNYINTGYPLFPLPFTIGHPDWKLPEGMTSLLNNYIILSNRFYSHSFINSFAFRGEHSIWFGLWFKAITPEHKLLILLSVASILFVLFKKKRGQGPTRLRTFMLLLLLMEAVWFFTAPSPRFNYASLLCTAFLPLSLLVGQRLPDVAYRLGLLVATCCILLYIPHKTKASSFASHNFLYPSSFKDLRDSPLSMNGATYHHPDKPADGYPCVLGLLPLPCTCQWNPFLQPRGPSLRDGFRMHPLPDSSFIQQYNY